MLKGIAASQGIAVAKVYKLEQPVLEIVRKEAKAEEELAKLDAAFKKTVEDIEKIKEVASKSLAAEELAVFDAHLMMANDPELRGQIEESIKNEGVNAEFATDQVANMMVSIFESMEDAYMRERACCYCCKGSDSFRYRFPEQGIRKGFRNRDRRPYKPQRHHGKIP